MASSLPPLEEDLTCPMCREIFQHPVLLSCSHGFCKACLQRCWTGKRTKDCPVCKRRSSKEQPPTNLIMKSMCDKVLEEKRQKAASLNSELLTMFSHENLGNSEEDLIDEVMCNCEQQLEESLKALEKKRRVFGDVKANYDQGQNHIKVQARDMERQIREQFKRIHQFLHNEEEARIAALMEEEERRSQKIKERVEWLNGEMAGLSDTIRAVEVQLQSYDHVSFLKNYKALVDRVQLPLKAPQPASGVLLDEAKRLGNLTFTVWNEMGDSVLYSCDPGSHEHSLELQLQLKLYFNITDLQEVSNGETPCSVPTQRDSVTGVSGTYI